jgi:hypothetical protein
MAGNGRKRVWHQNDRVVDTGMTGMRKLKGGSGDACPTTLAALLRADRTDRFVRSGKSLVSGHLNGHPTPRLDPTWRYQTQADLRAPVRCQLVQYHYLGCLPTRARAMKSCCRGPLR